MKDLFNGLANAGDDLIKMIRKGEGHAILIGLTAFIPIVDLAVWVMILCAIYRGKK